MELKRSGRLPGLGKLLGNEILGCIYTQLSEILKNEKENKVGWTENVMWASNHYV